MRHSRQAARFQDRSSRFPRSTRGPALAGEALDQTLSWITKQPMLSACLGVAAGFVLGKLIPRRG